MAGCAVIVKNMQKQIQIVVMYDLLFINPASGMYLCSYAALAALFGQGWIPFKIISVIISAVVSGSMISASMAMGAQKEVKVPIIR